MGVVVGDGHFLELIEQILPELIDGSLGQEAHQQALTVGSGCTQNIDAQQLHQLAGQCHPAVGIPAFTDIGYNIIVDQGLEEIARPQIRQGGDQHHDQHCDQQRLVGYHIVEQPQQGSLGILGLPEVLGAAGAALSAHGAGITAFLVIFVFVLFLFALGIHLGSRILLLSHPDRPLPAEMHRFPDRPCSVPSARRGCPCR